MAQYYSQSFFNPVDQRVCIVDWRLRHATFIKSSSPEQHIVGYDIQFWTFICFDDVLPTSLLFLHAHYFRHKNDFKCRSYELILNQPAYTCLGGSSFTILIASPHCRPLSFFNIQWWVLHNLAHPYSKYFAVSRCQYTSKSLPVHCAHCFQCY